MHNVSALWVLGHAKMSPCSDLLCKSDLRSDMNTCNSSLMVGILVVLTGEWVDILSMGRRPAFYSQAH